MERTIKPTIMTEYPYKKLDFDTHEIRVLVLQPSRDPDSSLMCTIEHESLISPRSYAALSYYWGAGARRTISIGKYKQVITENLWHALRAIRGLQPPGVPIRLWVDAMCINQNDMKERSEQVRMMRQIYSKAGHVAAYLGRTKLSQDDAEFLQTKVTGLYSEIFSWTRSNWDALNVLFCLQYWKRVWIIQELTVALNVTMLLETRTGSFTISWGNTSVILELIKRFSDESGFKAYLNAVHLLDFKEHFLNHQKPINLFDAMMWSRHCEATDPRDRIFALLGLCHDGAHFVPVPNYRQSLDTIIVDMTQAMMRLNQRIYLKTSRNLKHPSNSISSSASTLPSWVPDWPSMWSDSSVSTTSRLQVAGFPITFVGMKSLKIRSTELGKVVRLTTVTGTPDMPITQLQVPRIPSNTKFASSIAKFADISGVDYSKREDIWRCLLSGNDNPFPYDGGIYFSKLWTREGRGSIHNLSTIDWLDRNAGFRIEHWTLQEWSRMATFKTDNQWMHPETDERFWVGYDMFVLFLETTLSKGSRLASVKEPFGELVALVHPDTEEKDIVVLLAGKSVPVILREAAGSSQNEIAYQIIGGAYINDIVSSSKGLAGSDAGSELIELQ